MKRAAAFAACMLGAGAASLSLGKDANWDLRNYHFYDAHAFVTGRLGLDLAPAQAQTFHNPIADLPFYFLVRTFEDPRIVAFAMALPTAVAWFFLLRLLLVLFPADAPQRALSILAATAIGLTGAAGGPVIGSTMNEWHCAALLMPALFLVVRGSHGWAGLLAGIAVGLKLTYGVFAVGLFVAVLTLPRRMRHGAAFAGAALAGFLLSYGYWGWLLQQLFQSPMFPYFNAFFGSPLFELENWMDRRFGPRNALQALAFPLWFSRVSELVAEGSFRDYRLAVLFVLALLGLALRSLAMAPAWRVVATFSLVSYALWVPLFSIYRYLVPLELLSGGMIVGLVGALLRRAMARRVAIVALAALLLGTTRWIGWERVPFGERYFQVAMPRVEPNALVVVGHLHPMAYAVPFFPRDARFVSPRNNLLAPGQRNLLARRIEALATEHAGPLYLLEYRADPEINDPMLARFGLNRADCKPVGSDIDRNAMQLCQLERRPAVAGTFPRTLLMATTFPAMSSIAFTAGRPRARRARRAGPWPAPRSPATPARA